VISWGNLINTAGTNNVVSTRTQDLLLGGRLCTFRHYIGKAGCAALIIAHRSPLSMRRLSLFPFHTAPVVAAWFPPQLQHLSCCFEIHRSSER
jgi:hypothetical protein